MHSSNEEYQLNFYITYSRTHYSSQAKTKAYKIYMRPMLYTKTIFLTLTELRRANKPVVLKSDICITNHHK